MPGKGQSGPVGSRTPRRRIPRSRYDHASGDARGRAHARGGAGGLRAPHARDPDTSGRPQPRGAGLASHLRARGRGEIPIPIGAGLGGGSSDAAGLLAGVNHLLALRLTKTELQSLGARLGSDVPFFFEGGTARATGRGERVRQLCPIEPFWAVLVTPPIAISTTWAYGRIRFYLTPKSRGATLLASAIGSREWGAVADAMHNVFEDVVLPEFPSLAELKRSLIGCGTVNALLSGSGSTLYGVTRSFDEAMRAAKGIAGRGAEVRVVRTLERGVYVARRA
ncbi:MAG: 4-(cytidine 5'-diphospho)-2-C-methyl-D-erythritol kinase [Candidatus Eisenbacteria bacterium]|uniref:4-(cytidine 5'-diphospho)-2-C-methyl-D-erythritol kinase n=1 Tax=Eiseniibacteriota bacterium TaxID=2212470 RepID=A0A538TM32_UNCEI|nr:MAG: 4-(cytidine 5'-diphospho)-2-C-methyl-D-erythritol kinase [Candidatus Eisenbacteria bacterium]